MYQNRRNLYEEKQALIKANQELYSWYWFYSNDCSNLQHSRYPKYNENSEKLIKLEYSKRHREDRLKADKLWYQIKGNYAKIAAINHERQR